jgi:hypothetical protein
MDSTSVDELIGAARSLDTRWRKRWAELHEQFGGKIPEVIEDPVLDAIEYDLLAVERQLETMGIALIDLLDPRMMERGPVT